MAGESVVESSRVHDAASCRAWLERSGAAEGGRLLAVDRLLRSLTRAGQDPERTMEIVEQARPVHVNELQGVFERLDAATFPLPESDRARCSTALESLRIGRNLYTQLHGLLLGDAEPSERHTQPAAGASDAVRTLLPLARAIDYQARLLRAMLQLRIAVPADEWDELCTLARSLRASTFLDVPLPDKAPLLRSVTARGLFTYPLLLWLAQPEARTEAEFSLIDKLARRWAGRVGFRLEQGAIPHDGKHGPSFQLTERHTVRLVTHRLERRLEDRRREVEVLGARASARLPKGITLESTQRLLRELVELWCAPRAIERTPDVRLGAMRLRFGLPKPGAAPGRRGEAGPALSRPGRGYIYGRFEENTLMRVTMVEAARDDRFEGWAKDAEPAEWVSVERQRSVFETSLATGRPELGGLVLIAGARIEREAGDPPRAGGDEPKPLRMLGRVVSMSQSLPADSRQPPRQRITVTLWPGRPALAGVRRFEAKSFEEAIVLAPEATGEQPTLLMPSGYLFGSDALVLREAGRDTRVRVEETIERGPGFERVRFTRTPG